VISCSTALSTVLRATPSSCAKSREEGICAPGAIRPARITARSLPYNCRCSGSDEVGSSVINAETGEDEILLMHITSTKSGSNKYQVNGPLDRTISSSYSSAATEHRYEHVENDIRDRRYCKHAY